MTRLSHTFGCGSLTLAGTLDTAPGSAGLLIVSGGTKRSVDADVQFTNRPFSRHLPTISKQSAEVSTAAMRPMPRTALILLCFLFKPRNFFIK